MKITVEAEVEPEELRRLIGLPDVQPLWDSVNKRIAEGDTEFIGQITKSLVAETAKSSEILSRLVKNVSLFTKGSSRDKSEEEPNSKADTAASSTQSKPSTRRPRPKAKKAAAKAERE